MVNVVGILKDKIALPVLNTVTNALTPLDTYYTARSYTVEYPLLRNYLWKITLPSWSAKDNRSEQTLAGNLSSIADKLIKSNMGSNNVLPVGYTPRVVTASVPFPKLALKSVTYQGWTYSFPDTSSTDNMTMDVYADENGYALAYYYTWINLIKNRDGTFNYPVTYQRDVPITLYRTDGSPVIEFVAKGVYPTSMSALSLTDGSSSQIVKSFKITFNLDEIGLVKINEPKKLLNGLGTTLYSALESHIL